MTDSILVEVDVDPTVFQCTEARVVEIAVKIGTQVQPGDVIAEFESDKSVFEVSAPAGGVIAAVHLKRGQIIHGKIAVANIEARESARILPRSPVASADLRNAYGMPDFCTFAEQADWLDQATDVRAASPEDAASIHDLWRHTYSRALADSSSVIPFDSAHQDWFKQEIEQGEDRYWVAELLSNDASVTGAVKVATHRRTPVSNLTFIGLFVRLPELSWTPGKKLLREAIEHCSECKYKVIFAFTHPANQPATQLLRWSGFTEVGEFGSISDSSGRRLLFQLDLA